MVDTDRLQNSDNTDRQAQLNGNPKGLVSLNNTEEGRGDQTEIQWTQDKLTADKRRKSMKKEAVAGQWDKKRRETATWASDHKAALHPQTPHHPPQIY